MGHITFPTVACRQSPAIFAIAFIMFRVFYTICPVNEGMIFGLHSIINVMIIFQFVRVDTHIGVLFKKQWTALFIISQRQYIIVIRLAIFPARTFYPAVLIQFF